MDKVRKPSNSEYYLNWFDIFPEISNVYVDREETRVKVRPGGGDMIFNASITPLLISLLVWTLISFHHKESS
jgi:hypothetical protein